MKYALIALVATLVASPPTSREAEPMQSRVFDRDQLVQQLHDHDRPYLPFLDTPHVKAGLYRLEAGQPDRQTPHELDEIYYVIEGRATFVAGDERRDVAPGSVIYVRRHADHRFVDITRNLLVLVVFAAGPDETPDAP